MKDATRLLLLAGCLWAIGPAAAKELSPLSGCLQAQLPTSRSSLEVSLTTLGTGAGVRYQGQLLWQPPAAGPQAVHLHLQQPADLAGVAWLWREQDGEALLSMYLPGTGRVRHMRGEALSAELWGSGLRYSDLRYLLGIGLEPSLQPQGSGSYAGRETRVLAASIPPASGWGDARLRLQVDARQCVVLELSFYAHDGRLTKSLRADADSLSTIDSGLWPRRYLLSDHRQGRQADLRLDRLRPAGELGAAHFRPESFHRFEYQPEARR